MKTLDVQVVDSAGKVRFRNLATSPIFAKLAEHMPVAVEPRDATTPWSAVLLAAERSRGELLELLNEKDDRPTGPRSENWEQGSRGPRPENGCFHDSAFHHRISPPRVRRCAAGGHSPAYCRAKVSG